MAFRSNFFRKPTSVSVTTSALKAKTANPLIASGIVYTVMRLLGSSSSLSLISGTNGNLTINSSTGAITASAAIPSDTSQTANVREVLGQLAIEYPVIINAPPSNIRLLTAADFGNAPWTINKDIGRWMPKFMVAPLRPGYTAGINLLSSSNRLPSFDQRQDVEIIGAQSVDAATQLAGLSGSLQVSGGRNGLLQGIDTNGQKVQWVKFTGELMVQGNYGNHQNTDDGDGLIVGGNALIVITKGSISGNYLRGYTTGNNARSVGSGPLLPGSELAGPGVLAGSKVVDYGKTTVTGSMDNGQLVVTALNGAPIYSGMHIEGDGGVDLGYVMSGPEAGGIGTYWVSSRASYPSNTRFYLESTGAASTVSSAITASVVANGGGFDLVVTANTQAPLLPGAVIRNGTSSSGTLYGTIDASATPGLTGTFPLTGATATRASATQTARYTTEMGSYKVNNNYASVLSWDTTTGTFQGSQIDDVLTVGSAVTGLQLAVGQRLTGTNVYTWTKLLEQLTPTTWRVDKSKTVATTTMTTRREVEGVPEPVTATGQFNYIELTHGTNRTRYRTGGTPSSGENSITLSDFRMTGNSTARCTLTGNFPGGTLTAADIGTEVIVSRTAYNNSWRLFKDANRNWEITSFSGSGASTVIDLVSSSSTDLPPSNAVMDVATYGGKICLMGEVGSGLVQGEHSDAIFQTDGDKFIYRVRLHGNFGGGNYQPSGIRSNTVYNESYIEESHNQWQWQVGIRDTEEYASNIARTGMALEYMKYPKVFYRVNADISARPHVNYRSAVFPNGIESTVTQLTVTNKVDPLTGFNSIIYTDGLFLGGVTIGFDPTIALDKARCGWGFSTRGAYGYSGQRDPDPSEMTGCSFQLDVQNLMSNASADTHIGWLDITVANTFPGALANGDNIVIDLTTDKSFVSVGSATTGRRVVRGKQAVVVGDNTFNVIATIRGTNIQRSFGPFNVPCVSTGVTSTLAGGVGSTGIQLSQTSNVYTVASLATVTTGAPDTAARTAIIGVVIERASTSARNITGVTLDNGTTTLNAKPVLNTFKSQSQSANTAATDVVFYQVIVPAGFGSIGTIKVAMSGAVTGVAAYTFIIAGFGIVHEMATAESSTVNGTASATVGVPAGYAVVALHGYASAAGTGARRASAMYYKPAAAVPALTVTSTPNAANTVWSVSDGGAPVEPSGWDQSVVSTGVGANALTLMAFGPST